MLCSGNLRTFNKGLGRLSCHNRQHVTICASAKGFGAAKKPKKVDEKVAPGRSRGRRISQPTSPVPTPEQGALSLAVPVEDPVEHANNEADEAEFLQRLKALKAEAKEKKAAAKASTAAAAAAPGSTGAVFDAPQEDIYANPPSLMDTLQDKLQSDISDPALRRAKIGPGVAGLALGSVVLGLVIVLVSGGDMAPGSSRYKGIRTKQVTEQEFERLAARADGYEDQLKKNPKNMEVLEALAVTYAKMQDYPKAAGLLDQLVAGRPDYMDAYRLLGEATLLSGEPARSVAAYEKALQLSPSSQTVLTGLTDAYIANSQQSKAVATLTKLRDQASTSSSSSSSTSAGDGSSTEGGDAAASGSASSSSSRQQFDPVAVQLLLGKAYAGWRGHDTDALAAYDALIKSAPEDFRGYLAKGVFLKERGRRGDAERMFLQAKFYAPDNMQAFVASRAGEEALVDLPDNN